MATTADLDHNATTPLRPEARDAILAALTAGGNPSSVHRRGRAARHTVEEAREALAACIGAGAPHIVFTSGGTEANGLALRGSAAERILVSAVEHPCVRDAVDGAECLPVDAGGRVDLDRLDTMLAADRRPTLVAVMLANNETGVLQPVAAVAETARRHGATVHCDAVQGLGRVPVQVDELGVDTLALSAHKVGGPTGVGALYVRPGVRIAAQARGGGQERRLRAGTENVAGIAGFAAAAQAACLDLPLAGRLALLRDRLEAGLRAAAADVTIFGAHVPRLPNTSCFAVPGVGRDAQLIGLDLAHVAVSSGAACSSGSVAASHVLTAMGVDDALARCAIRVSFGWTSDAADVERFFAAWLPLMRRARTRRSPAPVS